MASSTTGDISMEKDHKAKKMEEIGNETNNLIHATILDTDIQHADNANQNNEILDGNRVVKEDFNIYASEKSQNKIELERHSQTIMTERPTNNALSDAIMNRLEGFIATTTEEILIANANDKVSEEKEPEPEVWAASSQRSTTSTTAPSKIVTVTQPYPPVIQVGIVADQDLPFAHYGHLDRETIAKECDFNLNIPDDITSFTRADENLEQKSRLAATNYAITCWTEVPREIVMEEIKRQLGIENIQYVCIGQEMDEKNNRSQLHIQIIVKSPSHTKRYFLDKITGTRCHYQVTGNDRAWNEYIKKGLHFIEFGTFKSVTAQGSKICHSDTTNIINGQVGEETIQQRRDRIAKECLELARTNVENAMDHLQEQFPYEFASHSTWYLSSFTYVHLRVNEMTNDLANLRKEYMWPTSFPDCTPALRDTVNKWLKYEFTRAKRARCLILIGKTGTGKTSFAMSLPGVVNYFKGRWRLNAWNNNARYLVFDNIPWNRYKKLNFPEKKHLLTQNGLTNATDKYARSLNINVTQPAIVLLNPGRNAGVLGREPRNNDEEEEIAFWNERALIYRMGPDEYFYKEDTRSSQRHTPENRIGDPDEFENFARIYQQKHRK